MKILKKHRGYSALIFMLMVSAVALIYLLSNTFISLDNAKASLDRSKAVTTFAGTEACLEEALNKLSTNSSYAGELLTVNDVSCTITVSGAGSTRTINVTSTYQNKYSRALEADVELTPTFKITSWTELTN